MRKKWGLCLIAMVMILALAACGGNEDSSGASTAPTATPEASPTASPTPAAPAEVAITHSLGETTVQVNPETVVVFDYGSLDSLDKLGIEVAAVPQSNVPPYLEKYADSSKYANAGTLQEPDFERLSALNPDLIIISGRQSAHYEELSKLGPTIFLGVDTTRYMESYEENARIVGEIFNKTEEVEADLSKVKQAIANLNAQVTAADKNALIVLTTSGKLSAFGPGSRFGIIHDVLGFKAVDDTIEVTTHGQSISYEFIAEKNPDYLFVIDRDAVVTSGEGAETAQALIENDLVKNTNAYKNGKIVYLDPNYWYLSGGGLLSVEAMVEEVANGF